jgi:hypothetical protein
MTERTAYSDINDFIDRLKLKMNKNSKYIKVINSQLKNKKCPECNAPMKAKMNVNEEVVIFVKHKKKCKWYYLNER